MTGGWKGDFLVFEERIIGKKEVQHQMLSLQVSFANATKDKCIVDINARGSKY
jgi:hypothetical protein